MLRARVEETGNRFKREERIRRFSDDRSRRHAAGERRSELIRFCEDPDHSTAERVFQSGPVLRLSKARRDLQRFAASLIMEINVVISENGCRVDANAADRSKLVGELPYGRVAEKRLEVALVAEEHMQSADQRFNLREKLRDHVIRIYPQRDTLRALLTEFLRDDGMRQEILRAEMNHRRVQIIRWNIAGDDRFVAAESELRKGWLPEFISEQRFRERKAFRREVS